MNNREEKQDILQSVEIHIHDALEKISNDPTISDLEEVLSKMDPPKSYGRYPSRPSTGLFLKIAGISVIVIILGIIVFFNRDKLLSDNQIKQRVENAVHIISQRSEGEQQANKAIKSLEKLNQDIVLNISY